MEKKGGGRGEGESCSHFKKVGFYLPSINTAAGCSNKRCVAWTDKCLKKSKTNGIFYFTSNF